MSKRIVKLALLFVLVAGVTATVLLWDSGSTNVSAGGCNQCFSDFECTVNDVGRRCNEAQGCFCRIKPGCGPICTNE